jgi:uncharacterized protein (TIGR02270 family)
MNMNSVVDACATNPYREVFEQYVDNASFLWVMRSIAVDQPHYKSNDIFALDQRIESQLDGLMTSIDLAWSACVDALESGEAGEVFTSSVVAYRSHDINKIKKVVEVGLSSGQAVKGLISALGWLPGHLIHDWINKFFTSKDLNHKFLAAAACSIRRENPGELLNRILERADCRGHLQLYARSLRLVGELRRLDLMPYLDMAVTAEDENIRFWALWSSVLLGRRDVLKLFEPYIFTPGPHQNRALNLVFRVLPIEHARAWVSTLANSGDQSRAVIQATGILGDPHAVNWLIGNMKHESLAKLAGEAFSVITGIDLEVQQLVDESKNEDMANNDDEMEVEVVALDEDENLPMPDYEKVKRFWMNYGRNFIAGQRYFLGKTVSAEYIKSRLHMVTQRQLKASAYEVALIDPAIPLLNYKDRCKG